MNRARNSIGLAIILATAVPPLSQATTTTATSTTTTSTTSTTTSTTSTTLPQSVVTLQGLAALETELSLCLSFKRLRDQRIQNLEQHCHRPRCMHRLEVLRMVFDICERDAVNNAVK